MRSCLRALRLLPPPQPPKKKEWKRRHGGKSHPEADPEAHLRQMEIVQAQLEGFDRLHVAEQERRGRGKGEGAEGDTGNAKQRAPQQPRAIEALMRELSVEIAMARDDDFGPSGVAGEDVQQDLEAIVRLTCDF